MMDHDTLLGLSASVEKAAFVVLPATLLGLWLATRRRPVAETSPERAAAPVTRAELLLLAVVLAGAAFLRLAWWDRGIPGTIFGGEIMTARADAAVQHGGLWAQWWQLARKTQMSSWLFDSPIVQPVVVASQWLLGPRLHGIVLAGAFFGVLGVALAWLAGRLLHGPRTGLLLAGLLAVSPLQVVWSRLGYRAEAAIPHLLVVLASAAVAGRRGSVLLAALTGLLAYASVYNYEAARVAIPLSIVALWASTPRFGRFVALSIVVGGVVLLLAATIPRATLRAVLWPIYPTYAGNQGERDARDFVEKNLARVKAESARSLHDYFVASRNSPPYPATRAWGVQYGGLVFLPITILGAIGVAAALLSGKRYLVWFAVLLLGLALPSLGCSTARRLLVFDLGWCAFAAVGLGSLTWTPSLRRVGGRGRVALATAFLAVMGAWALAAMVILREGPSYHGLYPVPFATGCVRDVVTCTRCVEAARQWQDDIRRGSLVMLVDSDLDRENATGPGGLPVYGQITAAAAGRRDRFQELYPILWNFNGLPDFHHYYPLGAPPTVFLADLLRRTPYATIVWQSERPTAWERWLARRLVAAGGRISSFETPLGDGPGFRVETEKAAESAVLEAIAAVAPAAPADTLCITATPVKTESLAFIPHALAPADGSASTPPTWFAFGWGQATAGPTAWPVGGVRHAIVDGSGRAHFLRADGVAEEYQGPTRPSGPRPETRHRVGRHCAAFAGGQWWTVDPASGTLETRSPQAWLPRRDWIGLTSTGDDELVLAAADQQVTVLDVATRTEKATFPAVVTPSRAEEFGECAQLVRGDGWIGVFQQLAGRLDVYDEAGAKIGSLDLVKAGFPWVGAVAARDPFLGVAQGTSVTTLRLDLSRCRPKAPS